MSFYSNNYQEAEDDEGLEQVFPDRNERLVDRVETLPATTHQNFFPANSHSARQAETFRINKVVRAVVRINLRVVSSNPKYLIEFNFNFIVQAQLHQ